MGHRHARVIYCLGLTDVRNAFLLEHLFFKGSSFSVGFFLAGSSRSSSSVWDGGPNNSESISRMILQSEPVTENRNGPIPPDYNRMQPHSAWPLGKFVAGPEMNKGKEDINFNRIKIESYKCLIKNQGTEFVEVVT